MKSLDKNKMFSSVIHWIKSKESRPSLEEQLLKRVLPEFKQYVDSYKERTCYDEVNLWIKNQMDWTAYRVQWCKYNNVKFNCTAGPPSQVVYLGALVSGHCIQYRYSETVVRLFSRRVHDRHPAHGRQIVQDTHHWTQCIEITTQILDYCRSSSACLQLETEQIEETRLWLKNRINKEVGTWIMEQIHQGSGLIRDLVQMVLEYL